MWNCYLSIDNDKKQNINQSPPPKKPPTDDPRPTVLSKDLILRVKMSKDAIL